MKNNNKKKGFTIVELVIVIAVIAILAAVMVPTFSNVIGKANKAAAEQELASAYKEAYTNALTDDGKIDADEEETVNGFTFKFGANGATCSAENYPSDFGYTATFANGVWTVSAANNDNDNNNNDNNNNDDNNNG